MVRVQSIVLIKTQSKSQYGSVKPLFQYVLFRYAYSGRGSFTHIKEEGEEFMY